MIIQKSNRNEKSVCNEIVRYKNIDKLQPNERALPELYKQKENCCGCTACYAICAKNAISMETDKEGFLYPVVDSSVCIRCYHCIKVCAFNEAQKGKKLL